MEDDDRLEQQKKQQNQQMKMAKVLSQANAIIKDKDSAIRLSLCCLLAGGHLLLEDVPGTGKTTLVKILAKLLGLSFNRVQFTNDLLPADLLGTTIYQEQSSTFRFRPGPIFASLVLADELNRASSKTQSACLQAMEEKEVSIDGKNYSLPRPFYLVATQNPRFNIGTYPLPESQLDRFLMRLSLGFPGREAERSLLMEKRNLAEQIELLEAVYSAPEWGELQERVQLVHASAAIIDYVLDLVAASRSPSSHSGLTPRAALGLLRASKAWAFIQQRDLVLPEDVQAVAVAVMNHRLLGNDGEHGPGEMVDVGHRAANRILSRVAVP